MQALTVNKSTNGTDIELTTLEHAGSTPNKGEQQKMKL